ncbi:spore germination protein GerPE [Brevibacillus sp. NRS-1366]|uniref:spore germination protein GerPE n=1 Tax=Brevibacillus sp. NRS-1366 TaxID=3233899 RepID=UPI003D235E1A
MPERTSHVHSLTNISIDTSSVLQIGDSKEVTTLANVLAVQRETAIFYENEFLFRDNLLFCEPIPLPVLSESIDMYTFHEIPAIRVNKVTVDFAAASAVIHVGSSQSISLESRIKNIRHLLKNEP